MVCDELEVVHGMLNRNTFERSELGLDYVRAEENVRRGQRGRRCRVKEGGRDNV